MREYVIVKMNEPLPEIDGRPFDPDYEDFCSEIEYASIDSYVWDAIDYRPEARAYVAHDADGLHVLMCAFENMISAEVKSFNGEVYRDSCLEFFLKPFADDARYMNIEVNACGAALIGIGAGRFNRTRLEEAPEGINLSASRHKDGWWAVRFDLPYALFENLFGRAPKSGDVMRGNFYKCDETIHPHFGTWAPVVNFRPDFHMPEWFGRISIEAAGA